MLRSAQLPGSAWAHGAKEEEEREPQAAEGGGKDLAPSVHTGQELEVPRVVLRQVSSPTPAPTVRVSQLHSFCHSCVCHPSFSCGPLSWVMGTWVPVPAGTWTSHNCVPVPLLIFLRLPVSHVWENSYTGYHGVHATCQVLFPPTRLQIPTHTDHSNG